MFCRALAEFRGKRRVFHDVIIAFLKFSWQREDCRRYHDVKTIVIACSRFVILRRCNNVVPTNVKCFPDMIYQYSENMRWYI